HATIDLARQLQLLDQLMHQANATEGSSDAAIPQVKPHILAPHHRLTHVLRKVEPVQPRKDPPLAVPHPFCNNLAHSKPSVLVRAVFLPPTQTCRKTPEVSTFFRLASPKRHLAMLD